ncbi:MAG: GGDEF domain-containing protein [Steroidobacteraceae bacterium]
MGARYSKWRAVLRGSAAALLLGATGFGATARASCFDVRVPVFVELRPLVAQNPTRALSEANARLAVLPSDAAEHDPRTVAALHAIQAGAYEEFTLTDRQRAAALAGLALLHDPTDPLRLELLAAYANSFTSPAAITRALDQIKQARALLRPGSRSDVCLEITQGLMNTLRDRSGLAIRELTQAYMQSEASELSGAHDEASGILALALRSMGDDREALIFNRQAIQWDREHQASEDLSQDIYTRGEILRAMGSFDSAIAALRQARAVSASIGDHQGVAYSDLRICEALIGLKRYAAARRDCERAAPVLTAGKVVSMIKETHAQLAKIDLAEGHPGSAVRILDQVLDKHGADMLAYSVAPAYLARAEANAGLKRYDAAYRDLTSYLRLYRQQNRASRARLREALEVRFQVKQAFERNAVLRRKLQAAAHQATRQKQLLHWMEAAGVAGVLVIALLSYIVVADRRHRRQLVRLARHDPLTGMPNRGHTVHLATVALTAALEHGRPFTVALIDFDYFKAINDQCGHAAGDHVLREFARLSRGALRTSDILGRWGGEEFLLVLPEATLDAALATVERLRLLALGIQIPVPSQRIDLPRVTFSAGLATTADGPRTLDELVASADAALYEAKDAGRDVVRISRARNENDREKRLA